MSLDKYVKALFHNILIPFGEKAAPTQVPEMSSTNAGNCYILAEQMEIKER